MGRKELPRISVLMGIYNCASTLPEALDSLYSQTYQNFKIIICDDGSTDNTYEVARKYAEHHQNIVLIKNDRNQGLNFTLNRCLEYADTEFIARMDGDDISMPLRFEAEIKFLDEHPEYGVVSTPCTYFDENGVFAKGSGQGEVFPRHFIHHSPICHAPCMARTRVFKAVGGYSVDDKLLRVEDYHLWFKIYAAGYKLYQMKESLYMMRDDSNATARRNWKNRRNEFYVRNIGYRMIGLPFYCHIFAFEPLIIYMLPQWIYSVLHKWKIRIRHLDEKNKELI